MKWTVILLLSTLATANAEPHWAFQAVKRPNPPGMGTLAPIDAFVHRALERAGLTPAPRADRRTQIRRLFLDMHGLPPTPEQIAAFEKAEDEDAAYSALVEQLLSSPRYGERWAQHWLDLVRYADTHGFEVNTERPNAWPYRDYVIRALNSDKPYHQFVFEQLAGDTVGEDAATGFLVAAAVLLPGQIGKDEASKRLARQDALDEIVVGTSDTFLALSVGCARCHDHKFDPISQRDYYAMQAFFAGVEYGDRPLRDPAAERQLAELDARIAASDETQPIASTTAGARPPVNARRNVERLKPVLAQFVRFTVRSTIDDNRHEPCIDELEIFDAKGENVALAGRPMSSGDNDGDPQHQLAHINDGRRGNARSWISSEAGKGWVQIELAQPAVIEKLVWGRDREGKFADRLALDYQIDAATEPGSWKMIAGSVDRLPYGSPQPANVELDALKARRAELAGRGMVYGGTFRQPDATQLLRRGDPEQPAGAVTPAMLPVVGELQLPADTAEQKRRVALAQSIANSANPLTARVFVNRVWQLHFGRGLVDTPSDFGLKGAKPSHPALLDWLAAEFVSEGWSIKTLHRQILLSQTYRQSNRIDAAAQKLDGDCRLLWRFPSRRLEAEAMRDSILQVSGKLNLKMGGPGFNFFSSRGGLNGFPVIEKFGDEELRRMIYSHKVRMERTPVFGAFDCPDAGQATPRRRQSTTAIQALNLFNSRFVIDQAEAFTARVQSEIDILPIQEPYVKRAFELALGRAPSETEMAAALPVMRQHGLQAVCRALFNSSEFLFLP